MGTEGYGAEGGVRTKGQGTAEKGEGLAGASELAGCLRCLVLGFAVCLGGVTGCLRSFVLGLPLFLGRVAECTEAAGLTAEDTPDESPVPGELHGLENAIAHVLWNCMRNDNDGLVNALEHLSANLERKELRDEAKEERRAEHEAARAEREAARAERRAAHDAARAAREAARHSS